jgi:hypothetical protein
MKTLFIYKLLWIYDSHKKINALHHNIRFENADSAKNAREQLNDCDIYSGCCTLRIEYAKVSHSNYHPAWTGKSLCNCGLTELVE